MPCECRWVRVMTLRNDWEIKEVAVIKLIKRVCGSHWSRPSQLAHSPSGSSSGFYGKDDRWLASVKTVQWAEMYKVAWAWGRGGGGSCPFTAWKHSREVEEAGLYRWTGPECPAARADLAPQALMMQTQASKQHKLLFVALHWPDTHLRAMLLFWAEAAGPRWRPWAWLLWFLLGHRSVEHLIGGLPTGLRKLWEN